ncbi:hypothetical protein PWT90_10068 [Aphanocladium album]|nr:hypothetical protein PWT90_10068 [Aphanocladium album]
MRDASTYSHPHNTTERVTSGNGDVPSYPDHAVAVTGMACKFAGAESVEQFWDVLETGTSLHRPLPKDRFPDWRFARRKYARPFVAATIDDVDAFDHKFFKVASREATFMDPQQRLGLQVIYQALESAGYFRRDDDGSDNGIAYIERDMGCYMATCINEYADNVSCHEPCAFSLTGSIRPFIAGKISHHFGWTGPAIMYDTACAASGTALHQACRAVGSGECQGAVVAGTNIFVIPDTFQNLAAGQFTSPTGASKAFDAAADGYCRGEGVAAVVLKKLSAALRDGDPIVGVIAATAVNQNANETNITLPNARSQASLYRKALQYAGLSADHVSYVEAHGTGTARGDPIEASSIRAVFGNPDRPSGFITYVGSHKSNIGHTEATSGLAGLIKVLLMMQKGVIPGQALLNQINPAIDPLEPVGMKITKENVPWTAKFKVACVNNYGASGTNATMVVMQPPGINSSVASFTVPAQNASWPVSINALTTSSLVSYCSQLLHFINERTEIPNDALLRRISYSLGRHRNPRLPYSVSETVTSLEQLKHLLSLTTSVPLTKQSDTKRPVVLFFGGQTGKRASVSRDLYHSVAIFRKHIDECDRTLRGLGTPSIIPALFDEIPHHDVVILHSILFSIQYASAMAWLNCGLQPACVIGHSFGQLTAMCVSGVLSLRDALRLVTERARLVNQRWGQDAGAMLAVEADASTAAQVVRQHEGLDLDIACYNGPHSVVISASTSSIDSLSASLALSQPWLRSKRLQVTHAFHSSLTEPLLRPLQRVAEQLNFNQARIPLETCSAADTWQRVTPALIASHMREPVYFCEAVGRIAERLGPCVWLEAGSAPSSPMLRRALGEQLPSHDIVASTLDAASGSSPIESLAETTAALWKLRVGVDYWLFHNDQHQQYPLLNLPPYQFDKARFWLDWKSLDAAPELAAAAAKIEDEATIPEPPRLLQLVQQSEVGAEFRINAECDEWRTLCAQQSMVGIPICPLSSLLGLICEAIDEIRPPTPPQETRVLYSLQDISRHSFVPAVTASGSLSLTIANAHHPQSWAFAVSDSLESNTKYASGTISAATAKDDKSRAEFSRFERLVSTAQIKALADDLDADAVKGKAVYRSILDWFQGPKSIQCITQVSAKGSEAAAYLMSPSSPFLALEAFLMASLVYLNSLQDRPEGQLYINTGIGHAILQDSTVVASYQDKSWAVYTKFFGIGDRESTCDIFAFDAESNQLSAVLLDVTFSRVKTESLKHSSSVGTDYDTEATSHTPYTPTSSHQPIPGYDFSSASVSLKKHHSPVSYASSIAKSGADDPRLSSSSQTLDRPMSHPRFTNGYAGYSTASSDTCGTRSPYRPPNADNDAGYYSGSLTDIKQPNTNTSTLPLPFNDDALKQTSVSSELTKSLYTLLATVADVEYDSLRGDALIVDLGIDSLMGMEVAAEISKVFSINLGVRELETIKDVESLCRVISDRADGFSNGSNVTSEARSVAPQLPKLIKSISTLEEAKTFDNSAPQSNTTAAAAHHAFDQIRDEFDVISKQTGCDVFFSHVYTWQLSLIVAYITEAFTELGCSLASVQPGQKLPSIPHLARNEQLLARLMRALEDHHLITRTSNSWVRTTKSVSHQPSAEQYERLMASFPQFAPEHKLLHVVGANLAGCLTGDVDPLALLFGTAEKRALMADQYLSAPIQRSVSRQLASFIGKLFRVHDNSSSTVRVLEIGGGTCGTTLPAVEAFAALGISVEYTFSDISSSFIAAARNKLRNYKFVQFRAVDVTKVVAQDQKGYYDMIIATNVLHATPDVRHSARNARQMLRAGGILTLAEYTMQDYYLLDVIFGQLEGWWLFNDGREHATMGVSGWQTALTRAGFGHVDWTQGMNQLAS